MTLYYAKYTITQFVQVWICEFCGTKNDVDLVPEEIPTKEEVTYLSPPASYKSGERKGLATPTSGIEESVLVFCIDISGSMCVTSEVIYSKYRARKSTSYVNVD